MPLRAPETRLTYIEPIRLSAGGPVIGMLPDCAYAQEQIVLNTGDLLVLFTDGVSEALNRDAPAGALIACLTASVDACVADAPQYDDMTIVVIRSL